MGITLLAMNDMQLEAFYEELVRFDWWYDYSDDHSVWTRGNEKEKELSHRAESLGGSGKIMFDKFRYDYKMGKCERPQLSDFIGKKII